jgi:hypothetical protein
MELLPRNICYLADSSACTSDEYSLAIYAAFEIGRRRNEWIDVCFASFDERHGQSVNLMSVGTE